MQCRCVAAHTLEARAGIGICTGHAAQVADVSYIDSPCDFDVLSDGKGRFRITGTDDRHFAGVYLEGQERTTAHWNDEIGESLGLVRSTSSRTGRPGRHPAVLLKLFIDGYLNRIPSSRQL